MTTCHVLIIAAGDEYDTIFEFPVGVYSDRAQAERAEKRLNSALKAAKARGRQINQALAAAKLEHDEEIIEGLRGMAQVFGWEPDDARAVAAVLGTDKFSFRIEPAPYYG